MNFTRSSSETMTSFQATLVNTGFGQLVLRDSLGKVAQKWTLANPKCVIGTGTNCSVSCQLPGIADHHVLMVIGAKQVFIRALAPGLTRNGQNLNELVIPSTETEFNFEIAGHHFQFSRVGVSTPVAKEFVQEAPSARPLFSTAINDAPTSAVLNATVLNATALNATATSATSETGTTLAPNKSAPIAEPLLALTPSRLKFTVVRALEKNRQAHSDLPSMLEHGLASGRPAWVEAIVRDALRPVEERLDNLNGPLQSIERRLRRQRARMRKARKLAQTNPENALSQPQYVPVLASELIQSQAVIEQYVQKHTTQLEKVSQSVGQIISRLSDVDKQLCTTQADRQELSLQFQQSNHQIASLQREMTDLFNGLQTQLNQPVATQTSSESRLWQTNIEAQLAELQVTLLALDDIKQSLQSAVEQNRLLKGDIELQQKNLGKLIAESTQKAVTDALAQSSTDSETVGQIVSDKVCVSLREQLGSRFTNDIAQQLTDSLNNDFAQPLSSQLAGQLSSQLSSDLSSQLSSELSGHLSDQISNQFTNQISNQFSTHVTGELSKQFANMPQPEPGAVNSEEIVQALRSSISELFAPLANTLHSNLQQTIQQAVDQSLQQSVQQTIAPMIEAATAAQIRAVAALPSLQLPSINETSVPAVGPPLSEMTERPHYEPAAQPLSSSVSDSQTYEQPTYEQPKYEQAAYEQAAYEQPAFEQPTDTSQGFDSQPYQPPCYESRAYTAPASAQASDSQAYDSQAFSESVEQEQLTDSHAQELPSWWADDPTASSPLSEAYPVGAEIDEANSEAQTEFDSTYLPTVDKQTRDGMDAYAQSAFSAEQLELGTNNEDRPAERCADAEDFEQSPLAAADNSLMQSPIADDLYDSVPYSEMVNRKPAITEEDAESYDDHSEFLSDYAPGDYKVPELVAAGLSDDYPAEIYQELPSEAFADLAQSEHLTQSVPAADNPTVPASAAKLGEDTDESVEDYMRRLLARMRGVSEGDVALPSAEACKPATVVARQDASVPQSTAVNEGEPAGEQLSEAWTEPFDPDNYVPRGSAAEKNRDLNALRELANTSARSAIQVSARRRQGSAILIKSTIACVGLIAGIALVSINGARINIAFIATIASFLVAVIWGYDASTSLRPLMQANRHQSNQKREADKAAQAEEAAQ